MQLREREPERMRIVVGPGRSRRPPAAARRRASHRTRTAPTHRSDSGACARSYGTAGGNCAAVAPNLSAADTARLLGRGRRERTLDRAAHELVHGARIAEAHLDLLRMHVDVDAPRVDREPQRERRLPVVVQHVAIGLAQRMREHAVADEAAVDEHVLSTTLRRIRRAHREARECARRRRRLRRAPHDATKSSPSNCSTRLCRPAAGRRCTTRPLCCSVNPTAGCASAMRRNASSQWPHSVASARRNLRRAGVLKKSSSTVTLVPAASAAGATGDTVPPSTSMRHAWGLPLARDASASRDTEAIEASASPRNPKRRDGFEVGRHADLRRRVPRNGERQLLARDAGAVVDDANALDATGGEVDVDLRRAGVDCVLEKLLQCRSGTLDHLAGGDLADQEIRKRADHAIAHGRPKRPLRLPGGQRAKRA